MNLTEAVASRLAQATYRFRNDQWECEVIPGEWDPSVALDGYSYEEGVTVIAACNWARMEES
ncbi:MAG: hypothetical protein JWL61_5021 [Gemmatimonadetes bacterium]|nr:hypothetical protein [Gemmatimonadota bacterium]